VKPLAVFLSGVAIAVAGAFTRSCEAGIAAGMASSWCGDPALLKVQGHAHCSGCALMALGGIIAVSAALLLIARDHVAPARSRIEVRK